MNAFLKNRFDASQPILQDCSPKDFDADLLCGCQTLECIAAFLKDASLSDILDARYRGNKGMGMPFLAADNDVLESLGEKRNFALENAFHSFVEPIVKALFPEETAQLHAKPGGHLIGRFCAFGFSSIRKVFGVAVAVGVAVRRRQFCRRAGGH
jgi:hypothetical protein